MALAAGISAMAADQFRSILREELEAFASNELHKAVAQAMQDKPKTFNPSRPPLSPCQALPNVDRQFSADVPSLPPSPARVVSENVSDACRPEAIALENALNASNTLEDALTEIESSWRRKPRKKSKVPAKKKESFPEESTPRSEAPSAGESMRRGQRTSSTLTFAERNVSPGEAPLLAEGLVRPQRNFTNLRNGLKRTLSGHNYLADDALRYRLGRLLRNTTFQYVIAAAIGLNTITVGLQADYMARNWTSHIPWFFYLFEAVFGLIFTCELLVRLLVHRRGFFIGQEWAWNCFDAVLVTLQIVEMGCIVWNLGSSVDEYTSDFSFRMTGMLRILRILRLIRLLRFGSMVHVVG